MKYCRNNSIRVHQTGPDKYCQEVTNTLTGTTHKKLSTIKLSIQKKLSINRQTAIKHNNITKIPKKNNIVTGEILFPL